MQNRYGPTRMEFLVIVSVVAVSVIAALIQTWLERRKK